jgi:hypothetical protein
MSYGVHIKRSEAQDAHGITLEEWLTYVRSDQEMCLVGEANFKNSQGNTVQWDAAGHHRVDSPSTGRKTGSTTALQEECLLETFPAKNWSRCSKWPRR